MSNKPFGKLNELDKVIRRTMSTGMFCGTVLTIEFINGFELFNTRPYHNYDTFSNGYRVTVNPEYSDVFGGLTVEAEDLDDALRLLKLKVEELKSGERDYNEN